MGIVYKIINNLTDEAYVGSTVNISRRRSEHFHHLRKGTHKSKKLQESYDLHGEINFSIKILERADNEVLLDREQYWMDLLKPEFNSYPTSKSPAGYKHSIESRQKMSSAHLGQKLNPESIAKRTLKQTGLKRSSDTIKKLQETSCCKPVLQFTPEGLFVKEWNSVQEIFRELGFQPANISACCSGRRPTSNKFKWKYKS